MLKSGAGRFRQILAYTSAMLTISCCLAATAKAETGMDANSGSPARDVLTIAPAPFQGVMGMTVDKSRPDWPRPVAAPAGAPNVLLIMTDDVGFGATSTFGGLIPTPNLDRLAAGGVRYNNFHIWTAPSPQDV
jgi:arylsulfatase